MNNDEWTAERISFHMQQRAGATISEQFEHLANAINAALAAERGKVQTLVDALKLAVRRMDRLDDAGTGEHSFAYDKACATIEKVKE